MSARLSFLIFFVMSRRLLEFFMYTYKRSDISDGVFTSSCVNKTRWNKQMSRSDTRSGKRPCFTLYISTITSCNRMLSRESKSARFKSTSYVSQFHWYNGLRARSVASAPAPFRHMPCRNAIR